MSASPAGRFIPIVFSRTLLGPSGQSVSGTVKQMDDFNLSMIDAAGTYRSWPREGLKFELEHRLVAHRQLLDKYTDKNMHDIVDYLETLK